MKCSPDLSPDAPFMDLTDSGITAVFESLAKRAGITKPVNPHMFRHAAITHAVSIGMQESAIKLRFWGNLDTVMLSTYITLSEQLQAQAYRDAKGMGNSNGNTVINPLASRCVNCGRLIQTGSLCKTCEDSKKLSEDNECLKREIETLKATLNRDDVKRVIEFSKWFDEEFEKGVFNGYTYDESGKIDGVAIIYPNPKSQ